MAGIPAGISTALVHLDAPVSFVGDEGRIHATISPSVPLVWEATGTPIGNFVDNISLAPGEDLDIELPHTDQEGFLDGFGNRITGWYYRIEVTYEKDGQAIPFPTRDFQVMVGQLSVDLALIPAGTAELSITAPILPVTSIEGLTGAVTKAGLGLNNVNNTTDAQKPVSTAQQAALDLKAPKNNPAFTGTVSGVSKSMVGLGSADNTADVDKPISTATQAALNGKAPTVHRHTYADIDGTVPTAALPPLAVNDTFPVASQAAMLALVAQRGDVAIRSDIAKSYILATDSPSTLADWKEFIATGQVVSVAGKTGVVALVKGDVGLGNADNTSDAAKPVSTLQGKLLATTAFTATLGQNLAGDYTGRYNSVGTGTDDRAGIQALLNAASAPLGSYQWSELQRKGVKVTIPAGVYWITAPSDGSPSLVVPEGVTADFSKAMMFFDYPAAPIGGWSAILVKNSGNLVVPYFMSPSGKNTAPAAPGASNTDRLYDGVRILGSNNGTTRISAVGASEIKGFKGASIRGIGNWVTRIDDTIVLSSDFGYIASNWPASNIYGYAHGTALPGIIGGVRLHTDVYFDGPYFNGSRAGGYLGVVTGDLTAPHELDYARSGGHQAYFKSTIFEHFAAYAVRMTGGLVSFTDCAFEEVGLTDQGMANFDTVQSIMFKNHRINYTGASVPGPGGTNLSPFIPTIFKIGAGIQRFTWESGYYHNTYSNAKFADASAAVYDVLAPRVDDRQFTTDSAMYTPKGRAVSSSFDKAMKLGSVWLWVDVAGVLRISPTLPAADTDGVAVGAQV